MNRRLVFLLLAAALIDVCHSDAPRTTEGGGGRKLRRRNDAAPARHVPGAAGDVGARLLKGGKEGKEKGGKGKKETKTHVDDTKGGDKMEKKKKGDAAERTEKAAEEKTVGGGGDKDKNAEKADAGNDKVKNNNNNNKVKNKNGGDVACDESLAGGSDVAGTSTLYCDVSSDCATGCCLTFPGVSIRGTCVEKCALAKPIAVHGRGQRCSP